MKAPCARCTREKDLHARGLCWACYKHRGVRLMHGGPPQEYRLWGADEVRRLRHLARVRDIRTEDIADDLGRSISSVRSKLKALGIVIGHRGGWPDVVKRAGLLDFFAANPGTTISEFARATGRSPSAVCGMMRALVREGLLARTGGASRSCRYVVTAKWKTKKSRAA